MGDGAPSIRIARLRLRVPGAGADAGRRVAEDASRMIAAIGTAASGPDRFGALRLRLEAPRGATDVTISSAIGRRIAQSLGCAGGRAR